MMNTEPNKPENYVSWEVTVPLMTNRFILYDLLIFSGVGWSVPSMIASLAAVWLASRVDWVMIFSIFRLVAICILFFLAFFAAVGLLLMKNRFFARYVINGSGISFETARGASAGLDVAGHYFSLMASPCSAGQVEYKTSKWVTWDKFAEIRIHPGDRVISLCGQFLPMIRLYCPDEQVYSKALAICREEMERQKESRT